MIEQHRAQDIVDFKVDMAYRRGFNSRRLHH